MINTIKVAFELNELPLDLDMVEMAAVDLALISWLEDLDNKVKVLFAFAAVNLSGYEIEWSSLDNDLECCEQTNSSMLF